jgi:tRNA (mo5U34)-methyltransferase
MTQVARKIPPAPPGFDLEKLFEGIFVFQKWEMFDGVFTPGINPIKELCDDMQLPADLSGLRVLDLGAWNGCLSFECERRGAREVVALEPQDPVLTGFYRIREAVGSTRTQLVRGTVYDLDPGRLGHFDVVLFCGVLYHLRYPLLAIDNVRRVCRGHVFVETLVSDAQVLVPKGDGYESVPMVEMAPELLSVPLWQFYRRDEMAKDPSNWFGPNATAVVQAFESAGFEMQLLKNWGRATLRGRVRPGIPEFLSICSLEGYIYDIVVHPLFGGDIHSWHIDQAPTPSLLALPADGSATIPALPAKRTRLKRWWRNVKRTYKRSA